jgi:dihydrodipicolinate synthase/N-acetylneuraminate lyase
MTEKTVSGIIPPLVTPMTSDLKFDKDAYSRLIEHVIEGGVHGLFIIGTNGECASLSADIRKQAIETAAKVSSGRAPVFVNISTSSYLETLQLADISAKSGADYVVLSPPFYFTMAQAELVRYFERIAGESSLPLFLYNAPQYTHNEITTETVAQLESNKNIAGIKDSSGDIKYIKQILNQRQDEKFSILIGYEMIMGECILMGCNGGVNGGGNVFPKLFVNMYRAASDKNLEEMEKWQSLIRKVYHNLYEVHDSPMGIIMGLKYALSRKGIMDGNMAMPVYSDFSDHQKENIDKFLEETIQYGI